MQLRWAVFKGISLFSKAIRFWTRSQYSHVGFLLTDNVLVECWGTNPFNIHWDFVSPPFIKHKLGTPVEIWSLDFYDRDNVEYIQKFMIRLALNRIEYDWIGVFSFVLKLDKNDRDGYFCSEGCITPIIDVKNLITIKPHHVSPGLFVNLIEAMGGRLENKFVL